MKIQTIAWGALALLMMTAAPTAEARNLRAKVDTSHNLWWQSPEKPTFVVNLTDTTAAAKARSKVRLTVAADTLANSPIIERTYKVTTRGSQPYKLTAPLNLTAPGFYVCKLTDLDDGTTISSTVIGLDPTEVVSPRDAAPDFDAFWARAKRELAEVPATYTIKLLPEESGQKRNIYELTYRSWGGDTIISHVAIPKGPKGKRYPAKIFYPGYNSKPWKLDPEQSPGWIEMLASPRGQFYCADRNPYGDFIKYHLNDPDTYYYKGAYLDAVRAIDILEQLPEVDTDQIYAFGSSQGGALTLAAAALCDGRLRAIAPGVPFMCDFPDYIRIARWPANNIYAELKRLGMTKEQGLHTLSYFDLKNLSGWIKCPTIMGIGLQDPTCPPHTNMSSYNQIRAPKELHIFPTSGHSLPGNEWHRYINAFFDPMVRE